MKNKVLQIFACVIAVLVIIAVVLVVLMKTVYKDKITDTSTKMVDTTFLIEHALESGDEINTSLLAEIFQSDNEFSLKMQFNYNQIKHYDVKNLSIIVMFGDDVTLPFNNYEKKGNASFSRNLLNCHFDGDYADLTFNFEGDLTQNVKVQISYDIDGKGLYSFNEFHNIKQEFSITPETT